MPDTAATRIPPAAPTGANGPLLTVPLLRVDGSATTLRDELSAPFTVVVFVRHFGCLFCRERAAAVRAYQAALTAAGAAIVFVGTGIPAMAAAFAREHAGSLPVLTDPTRRVFAAARMRRSLFTTLHWRLLRNLWRALRAGFRQTRVQGDAWQQGGVLVLRRDGTLLHRQVDRAGGDPIDFDAVHAALQGGR